MGHQLKNSISEAMKKVPFFFLYIAMGVMQVFAQEYEQTVEVSTDEFSSKLLKTSDELYIGDHADKYLMNKSPLSFFKGYKSIFGGDSKENKEPKEIKKPKGIIFITESITPYPAIRYGSVGKSEKDYTAYWILLDEQLYLCKIDFPDSVMKEQTAYSDMEKFTGMRFSKRNAPSNDGLGEIYGLMPATWFTDTLYVKKAVTKEDPFMPLDSWEVKPYLQMILNKRKLISKETVDNKIHTRKITVPRRKPPRKRTNPVVSPH